MPVRRRLLLIEDDVGQVALVQRYLGAAGFEILHLDSPIGATNAARSFRPDVVLLDLDLPGFSGDKLLPLLRKHGIFAPVIFYSAADPAVLRSAATKAGAAAWLSKSAALDELLALLFQTAASP